MKTKRIHIEVRSKIERSFLVEQVAGRFDFHDKDVSEVFSVDVPDESETWSIGVIVGPSGSGKSTVARHCYGNKMVGSFEWDPNRPVIACFDPAIPPNEITDVLASVGFASIPSWMKPYHVLSNGERFRCDLARALLSGEPLVVYDEFTSVVDRTVAKAASHALQKYIRRSKTPRKFVAVSCHYDILDWLCPDWEIDMSRQQLARGCLRQRPPITLRIARVHYGAWELFRKHHYLNHNLNRSAVCFGIFWESEPVGFRCLISNFGHPGSWIGHRMVVLPDFQGIGIAKVANDYIASLFTAVGREVSVKTSHPGLIANYMKSPNWSLVTHQKPMGKDFRKESRHEQVSQGPSRSLGRFASSFRHVGPTGPCEEAERLLRDKPIPLERIEPMVRTLDAVSSTTGMTAEAIARTTKQGVAETKQMLEVLEHNGKIEKAIVRGLGITAYRRGGNGSALSTEGIQTESPYDYGKGREHCCGIDPEIRGLSADCG